MNPFFVTDFSISDSLKTVRKSVLIYETIIVCCAERHQLIERLQYNYSKNSLLLFNLISTLGDTQLDIIAFRSFPIYSISDNSQKKLV